MSNLMTAEVIATRILEVRGKKVILDRDLAKLYGVETSQLTRQVRRNIERFPEDFMFQLDKEEFSSLMCHFGISKRGGTRKLPYVFTEQGVAMLSGVLNSKRAIHVNILIMRAFTKLRELLLTHKELATKIEALEKKYSKHDKTIKAIIEEIKRLLQPVERPKRKIGFYV